MKEKSASKLLSHLVKLTKALSHGRYGNLDDLYELTKAGKYPKRVVDLAESFGMMLVKVKARDYHLKQIVRDMEKVQSDLSAAKEKISRENRKLKKDLRSKFSAYKILGKSRQIANVKRMIGKVAGSGLSVLITGETGTGKELAAKALHYESNRYGKPFVALNCSAIPESLFESELFGIEKGVATGVDRRIGKMEQADGGTLFLDEIGDMPKTMQVKLLRVLQERELQRVGGRANIPLDINLIAATSKELKTEIKKHNFRKDLYYRINAVHIHMPSLLERKDDIPVLIKGFLDAFKKNSGRSKLRFSAEALKNLKSYSWPGNVRELLNEVERGCALSYSDTIELDDLSEVVRDSSGGGNKGTYKQLSYAVSETEKKILEETLRYCGGNKSKAARALGISREGLRKKLKRHGMA